MGQVLCNTCYAQYRSRGYIDRVLGKAKTKLQSQEASERTGEHEKFKERRDKSERSRSSQGTDATLNELRVKKTAQTSFVAQTGNAMHDLAGNDTFNVAVNCAADTDRREDKNSWDVSPTRRTLTGTTNTELECDSDAVGVDIRDSCLVHKHKQGDALGMRDAGAWMLTGGARVKTAAKVKVGGLGKGGTHGILQPE